ncbi:MAG: vanadium-dependent haloperoxidase [Saprospiraceae bacterium]|nr:vanadium-dependent haloperoxidase [Saprospiraceae bacterium]
MRYFILLLAFVTAAVACKRDADLDERPDFREAKNVVQAWNALLLDLERHTEGYRAPVSARMFAYMGMAAYESAMPALIQDHLSVAAYCPGYAPPPIPKSGVFNLPASLNAAYGQSIRHFFPTASQQMKQRIEDTETGLAKQFVSGLADENYARSVAYGRSVADAVWQWSRMDSLGHDAYLYNYDRSYVPPVCIGCWQPDEIHRTPALTPHWGKVRLFLLRRGQIAVNPPASFDDEPGSTFYTEAMEVFSVSQPMSKENRWLAEFWSDDVPGLTVTPAGRWISIANQAVEQYPISLPETLELYLRLGWALNDACVICWDAKYQYNVERPQAYVNRYIQPGWEPLHANPSFPAYPSGHSAFGAAAAEVLGDVIGYDTPITDRTHIHRKEFAGKPREFGSFAEMAQENAFSRVALGVHYRMDCEEGLRLGRLVGREIIHMKLRRNEVRL